MGQSKQWYMQENERILADFEEKKQKYGMTEPVNEEVFQFGSKTENNSNKEKDK